MDNEFAQLEADLLRLQPRRPGPRLEDRIGHELNPGATATAPVSASRAARAVIDGRRTAAPRRYQTATSWTSWKWANWTVAAALIVLLAVTSRLAPPGNLVSTTPLIAAESPDLRPVKAGRVLLGSRVDGVVELADGSAVERVRDFYVDTIEWQDPRGTAQLRWEVPREAVRYVGLAAY